MLKSLTLLLLAQLSSSLEAETSIGDFTEITVTVDSEPQQLYLMTDKKRTEVEINNDENQALVGGNPWGKVYFVTDLIDEPENQDYYFKPQLLGGSVEFDMDLSGSGCGCQTMLQLLGMPGLDTSGELRLDRKDIPHCDWRGKNKAKCPEWRLHEANTYGFRSSTATCEYDEDAPHLYESCNLDGKCRSDILSSQFNEEGVFEYGPIEDDIQYNIDTLKPFHVKTEFHQFSDTSELAMYTITLSQGDKEQVMTNDCGDLSGMTDMLAGKMTPVITQGKNRWVGKQAQGCDSPNQCEGNRPTATYSNFQFSSSGAAEVVPPPKLTFEDLVFSTPCQKSNAGECGDDCFDCRVSWPKGDEDRWRSEDRACRCKSRLPQYVFADNCDALNSGECGEGCTECKQSWLVGSSTIGDTSEAVCRCVPQEEQFNFTWKNSCRNANAGWCEGCDDNSTCTWSFPEGETTKSQHAACRCRSN